MGSNPQIGFKYKLVIVIVYWSEYLDEVISIVEGLEYDRVVYVCSDV